MHSKAVIAYNLLKCKNTIIMFFFGAIISRREFSSNCLSTKRCFAITIKCCLINFFSSFRFLGKSPGAVGFASSVSAKKNWQSVNMYLYDQ